MRLCRLAGGLEGDRLGVVTGDEIADVSTVLDALPTPRWGTPGGDLVIAALPSLLSRIEAALLAAPRLPIEGAVLRAPVAAPGKIIGAPVNYHDHLSEALADKGIHQGSAVHKIDEIGCFLKATSGLAGPGDVISLPFVDRRTDHEAEVAVVIGAAGRGIEAEDALGHVAGYCLALDMTVRGREDRSLRKSCDGFAVLGPWLTTADEIADPSDIAFTLSVNGRTRQSSSTALLIRAVPELIAMVSRFYTLLPGDVIMTGTPAGVGPVEPGDRIAVASPDLGRLEVTVGA